MLLNFSEKFHRVLKDARLSLENTEAGSTLSFFKIQFYLFLAVLGLHCCMQAFSSCDKKGLLLIAVHGLPLTMASLGAEHRL